MTFWVLWSCKRLQIYFYFCIHFAMKIFICKSFFHNIHLLKFFFFFINFFHLNIYNLFLLKKCACYQPLLLLLLYYSFLSYIFSFCFLHFYANRYLYAPKCRPQKTLTHFFIAAHLAYSAAYFDIGIFVLTSIASKVWRRKNINPK